jgi:pimeloyl-ACP methyl ester carboxylesterase
MTTTGLPRLEPLQSVRAGVLEVTYYQAAPNGDPVLLLHGFPYDIHSYEGVIPRLAGAGLRVVVPYLRGHGPTRFLDPSSPRSGQQAALGADVIDLLDALDLPEASLAGYDWGGCAACVAAALWPDRRAGLVLVPPPARTGPWGTLPTSSSSSILPPCRRSRSKSSPWMAWRMATSLQPTAPALHTTSPGRAPTTRCRTPATNAGHNLPQEAPAAFADAILEVAAIRSQNALQVRKD